MAGKTPNGERQVLPAGKQFRASKQISKRRFPEDGRRIAGKNGNRKEEGSPWHSGFHQKGNGKLPTHCYPQRNKTSREKSVAVGAYRTQAEIPDEDNLEDEVESHLPLKQRLINFHYERHKVTTFHEHRRPRRSSTRFSREAFVQANCNFMVSMKGSYTLQLKDPDVAVDWETVEEVCIKTYTDVTCPICLYPPVATKITRCGHVYCWSCITHYLFVDSKASSKCPICFDTLLSKDLKSVTVLPIGKHSPGDNIGMLLMKRKKGSLITMPLSSWQDDGRSPVIWTDWRSPGLPKLQVASAGTVLQSIVKRERKELLQQMKIAEEEESEERIFIQSALDQLKERERELLDKCKDEDSTKKDDKDQSEGKVTCQQEIGELPKDSPTSNDTGNPSGVTKRERLDSVSQGDEFYYYYQANDGQDIYIHPINVRCLIREYGSFEHCPVELSAEIVDLTTYSMSVELRKRFRYLSHLPLACEFSICEVLLRHPILSKETLGEFADEFGKRKKERERKKRQERRQEKKMEAKQTSDCFGRAIVRQRQEPTLVNLESQEEFPSQLSTPSACGITVATVQDDEDMDGRSKGPSLPSFSAALKSQKVTERPQMSCMVNVEKGHSDHTVENEFSDEGGSDYKSVPSFNESFSEALAASLQELAVKEPSVGGSKKTKKGRQKGKTVLFSTGLNRISH